MNEVKVNELKFDDEAVRKVGQYILKETLGKGGYSWVKKGVDEKTKQPVALKFMTRVEKSYEKEQAQQVRTEIKSLMRVNHVNVMKLYAYNLNCLYPEKSGAKLMTILLVLEYCPGGELFDILYYTSQLDAITARTFFIQMMKGIKACHDVGIVHRDIKPQNLLMDHNFQLKLTDFGLSFLGRDKVDSEKLVMNTHYVGTRGYQAPELLKRDPYTKACDIFSAGVVLFILLTGYPPFEQAIKGDKWFNPLYKKNTDKFWEQHKGCGVDDHCKYLLGRMMAYRATDRPTLEQVLNHPWVVGENARVHSPKELARVLKTRHRETRRRRRHDKKKMTEMQNSIKKQPKSGLKRELNTIPCPVVAPEDWVPTSMSFTTKADHLEEAYWLARNVFVIAFNDQTYTNESPDPWTLITAIKLKSDQGNDYEYLVQIRIVELQGLGKYCFKFSRLQGDPLRFRMIWSQIEAYFLSMTSADGKHLVFQDYVEYYFSAEDSSEEVKNSEANEVETKKVITEVAVEADDIETLETDKIVTAQVAEEKNVLPLLGQ